MLQRRNDTAITIGRCAEELACHFLRKKSLRLIERNYRTRQGEIDLVMEDGDTLVFVEVKHRRQTGFGSGLESINRHKQAKLIAAARYYLNQRQRHNAYCRFDIIAVTPPLNKPRIEWIKDAFQANDD